MGTCCSQNASKKNHGDKKSLPYKIEDLPKDEGPIWEWQSNKDPWATNELPKWTKFSSEQMQTIEKAFQEKSETVEIGGDYVVNFESWLQMHKEQSWKVRPVRRTEMSQRAERFCSELITPRTFGRVTYSGDPTIVEKWLNKRKFNFKIDKQGYNITDEEDMLQLKDVVVLAVKGILEEGAKENWSDFAKILTKRLEDCIAKNPRNIFRECIYIYTDENKPGASSLYTVVNKALREIDDTKIETLGPYCYLLNLALKASRSEDAEFFHTGKVYRGLGLEQSMLNMYKTAWKRGLQISFHSFVSTSKSIEVAAGFSFLQHNQRKALLIIENLGGASIETLSSHPREQEVLLPASCGFQITNIDEKNSDKIMISLKMVNTKLENLQFVDEISSPILLSHSSLTELPSSLSQWTKGKQVYFEINDHGKNITPEDKSLQLKEFVKLAAEGIRKVGQQTQDMKGIRDGKDMADMLMKTMKEEPENILKAITVLYTRDSFLYKEVNKNLRLESAENWIDLGPYCYLLNSYLIAINRKLATSFKSKKTEKPMTLFRTGPFSLSQINLFMELYEKRLHFAWSAFASTTLDRNIAEMFAHALNSVPEKKAVLFLISVPETMAIAFDCSEFSDFSNEREILLPPNLSFKITDIDTSKEFLTEIKLEFVDYIL